VFKTSKINYSNNYTKLTIENNVELRFKDSLIEMEINYGDSSIVQNFLIHNVNSEKGLTNEDFVEKIDCSFVDVDDKEKLLQSAKLTIIMTRNKCTFIIQVHDKQKSKMQMIITKK
jgi:hypothetical protein